MKKADKIFRLIQALSGTEKRYFKIFSTKHIIGEKNHYATLFDIIEKQKEFDDRLARKEFVSISKSTNYTEFKYYTYKMILKSLAEYHSKGSVAAELRDYLQQVEILINKDLFDEASQILGAAKKLAVKNEEFLYLGQILSSELDLLSKSVTDNNKLNKSNEILAELDNLFNQQLDLNQYERKRLWVNHLIVDKGIHHTDRTMQAECKSMIQQLRKINLNKQTSNNKKRLILSSLVNLNLLLKNWEQAFRYSSERVKVIEENIKANSKYYLPYLGRHIEISARLKKLKEANDAIKKIDVFYKKDKNKLSLKQEMVIFNKTFIFRILSIENATSDKEIEEIISDLNKNLIRFKEIQPDYLRRAICTEIVVALFKKKKYNFALDWINKAIEIKEKKSEENYIQFQLRMLNIIVHFELKNDILMESILRSTYHFLKKAKKLGAFEKYIISFLRKAIKTPSRTEIKLELKKLGTNLSTLLDDPLLSNNALYLIIIDWINTRVDRI